MSGVAGEKERAGLHRLDHEAAHLGDSFLNYGAAIEFPAPAAIESPLELVPDSFVGPLAEVFVGGALQIEPSNLRRAHAVQREAAIVVGVDQFVGRRPRFGENT